jgi:hypothetical protein
MSADGVQCPSCGGAGGGPFGRSGGAWDTEDYVCPRCKGEGVIALPGIARATESVRPGVAKATPAAIEAAKKGRAAGKS